MSNDLVLITIGALLLVGLALDELGRRTRLPRVSLLVLFGMAAGPSGIGLLPMTVNSWYPLVATMALVMVAFLLGGRLNRQTLAQYGRQIFAISISTVLITAALVGFGLWMIGADPVLCLVLAGISTATAPAATQDVVRRSGISSPFADKLLGIVAVDDAWGLILFSLLLAAGQSFLGESSSAAIAGGARELGGALFIGAVIGFPAAYLTGRLQPGEPSLAEALGVVFLCGGLALAMNASFLLAAMTAGMIVANMAKHHTRAFHEIESIEWPFIVLFFVLAGASLNLAALWQIGLIGIAYLALRSAGRIAGGWIGGRIAGMPASHRCWIGVAMMPQAGIALGMALVAAHAFPAQREDILAIAVGTTIVFELGGPVMTQWALAKTHSADQA